MSTPPLSSLSIGFLGTGEISTALVKGLHALETPPAQIWLSPRSREKSQELSQQYTCVHAAQSNQEVLDRASVIVLAFLPEQKEKVLNALQFTENHQILHILGGTRIEALRPLVAPARDIARAVPLPSTALHTGPIALYPAHETAATVFSPLGTLVTLETEAQLETLSIITGLLAPYYDMLASIVSWAQKEGVPPQSAAPYTASMFASLSAIALESNASDMNAMKNSCMTPGGLNELAMRIIDQEQSFAGIVKALEAVKEKIQ